MNVNRPETYWQGTPTTDDHRHTPAIHSISRFHWADHQLMLHLLAGVFITLMVVAMTLMITKH